MSESLASGQFSTAGVSAAALAAFREARAAASDQRYAVAIQYYTDVLAFTDTPPVFKARTFEYRGECYWLLGDFESAERDYQESLNACDDLNQIARARVRMGELADFCGQYGKAEQLYFRALAEGTANENLLVVGRAQRGLGILNRRRGDTDKAMGYLTQALAAFRQVGDAREQARVLTSLGRTRQVRGEYQHALAAHKEAHMILESLNDRWRVVQALNDIGESHQSLYDIENAYHYHEQALVLANEYGANLLKPEIKRNLGVDLVEQGRYEEGLYYLQAALEGARALGNREQEALALYNLARAYLRETNTDAARQAVLLLSDVAEELDADRFRALAAFTRGELLFYEGDRAAASSELNVAMLTAQSSLDRGVLWKLHAVMSHVVDNESVAAVHRTIAAEFIRQTAEPLQDPQLKATFVYAPPVLAVLDAAGIDPDKL